MLTGSNFLPDSKVVFIERGPGEHSWGRGAGRRSLERASERSLALSLN